MSKYKSNFIKYLAFIYPYISIIIYNAVIEISLHWFNYTFEPGVQQAMFICINATSLLFGINIIKNYNHKEYDKYK